jgi:hypothetical protein
MAIVPVCTTTSICSLCKLGHSWEQIWNDKRACWSRHHGLALPTLRCQCLVPADWWRSLAGAGWRKHSLKLHSCIKWGGVTILPPPAKQQYTWHRVLGNVWKHTKAQGWSMGYFSGSALWVGIQEGFLTTPWTRELNPNPVAQENGSNALTFLHSVL